MRKLFTYLLFILLGGVFSSTYAASEEDIISPVGMDRYLLGGLMGNGNDSGLRGIYSFPFVSGDAFPVEESSAETSTILVCDGVMINGLYYATRFTGGDGEMPSMSQLISFNIDTWEDESFFGYAWMMQVFLFIIWLMI